MDKIDYLILGELLLDAQTSFLQIAKKLKISSFTVKSRYDKMLQEGVIFRSSLCINLSKLGYQGKIFLQITNAPNQAKKATVDALKQMRNIISVSEIIGPFDVIAVAPITDFNSIEDLVSQVKKIPSVQRVSITCIKETSFPLSQTFGKILSKSSQETATGNKD